MASQRPTDTPAERAGDPYRLPAEIVFRPLRSRNLFEETVGRLREAIRLGAVAVGERFPTERELHELLKVSRITIREALRALEEAGFVEIRRGRNGGAYVLRSEVRSAQNESTASERDAAIDYRRAIELTITELAARRRGSDQLAQASRLLAECVRAPASGYRVADSRFHLSLAAMAASPRLAAAAADVQLQHSEVIASRDFFVEESMRHSNLQHAEVLAAIEAGDPLAARAAMTEHLEASALMLRSLY